LRIELGGQSCAGRSSFVHVRYEVPFLGRIVPQVAIVPWSVPATGGTAHVFVPVYRMLIANFGVDVPIGEVRLLALDVPAADKPCLISLATVRDPSAFPLRLFAWLGPDWQQWQLYQTLSAKGGGNTPGLP
jgi:hypothetical protein